MGSASVRIEKNGPLGWIVLDRQEKLNAMNSEMWLDFPDRLAELENDPTIRVIIIRGAGERAFCVGADISNFSEQAPSTRRAGRDQGRSPLSAFQALADCTKPTIAMIHGYCFGGGCTIALNIDIRIASEDAKFAITPAKLGLGYPRAEIERAVIELGPANTRYLLMTASRVSASQALAMGFVQEVHPASELEAATERLATTIAGNAPKTLRAAAECVRQSTFDLSQRDPGKADALIAECFQSEDFKEGVTAFAQKRPPNFQDK